MLRARGWLHVAGGPHAKPVNQGSIQACTANVAAKFHEIVTYQPASRYWLFQAWEKALFVLHALAPACLIIW